MEIRNRIPKLNIQVVTDGNLPCIRELEAYRRGRARRNVLRQQSAPDVVIVAMNSPVRAKAALERMKKQHSASPVITVVGDDPSWETVGGTTHIHRDGDLLQIINQVMTTKSLSN